jgi:hypothetical protein
VGRVENKGMTILNLEEFLQEIKPSIKWSASTGYHRCSGCGRQLDSAEKLTHWPKHCSLSKDKTVQKLRSEVLSNNFPDEAKPALQEVALDWYQNQIKITASLAIDFKLLQVLSMKLCTLQLKQDSYLIEISETWKICFLVK